jgi:transposase InsO family protein
VHRIGGPQRVERLMRSAGLRGVDRRRRRGCTTRDPHAAPSADLVQRRFVADRPDAVWVTDITQHRTGRGSADEPPAYVPPYLCQPYDAEVRP